MTTLHLVRATLGLAALLLAAPAAQAFTCTSTISFADGGADAIDCAGQTVDIGYTSGGILTLRSSSPEIWTESTPFSSLQFAFNQDVGSFPGSANQFTRRPASDNQRWDEDFSVVDDLATFTASDGSEIILPNDGYIYFLDVDFAGFVDGGTFELTYVPEPSTAALTALGLIGMAARRRRS